jgi:hypothetical protein
MPDNADTDGAPDAQLSTRQIADAILMIEEKLAEFKRLDLKTLRAENVDRVLGKLVATTNRTLKDVLGAADPAFMTYELEPLIPQREMLGRDTSLKARLPDIKVRLHWAVTALEELLDKLREKYSTSLLVRDRQKVTAWDNLGLHERIAHASFGPYLRGDYVQAVLAATTALSEHPPFKRAVGAGVHQDGAPGISFGSIMLVLRSATTSPVLQELDAPQLELAGIRELFGAVQLATLVGCNR